DRQEQRPYSGLKGDCERVESSLRDAAGPFKGGRMPRPRFILLACVIACAAAVPAASAAVTHDGSRTFRQTTTGHDLNICGLPGTFDTVTRIEWHMTDGSGGFHFQLSEVSRWTVTFDDPALGVWSGRGTETDAFTA